MSVIHLPLRVDWPAFMATFPEPGPWTRGCKRALDRDNDRFVFELVPIYSAVRPNLPAPTVRAVDLLLAVIDVNGVPKEFDTSSLYVPHRKYKKSLFENGETESPIPQASPEQVELILDAVATADLKGLTGALKTAWPKLHPEPSYFQSAAEYTGHLKNWLRILEEIRKHGDGLAIEFV